MSVIDIFSAKSKPVDRFELLLRPHIESLYRFAYRLSQSQSSAEELVQQLLTKLYPKINQLEGLEKIRPWLMRALYNLYIDSFRKNQLESSLFTSDTDLDTQSTQDMSPEANTGNEEIKQRLQAAIQQLNQNQRDVILLHDAEGYTLVELEEILQTPIGTLKSRLNRARNTLKPLLSMEPFDEEHRVKDMKEMIS